MNDKTLIPTFATSSEHRSHVSLLLYALLSGRNPRGPRLAFGIFVSVLPAVCAYVVLKLNQPLRILVGCGYCLSCVVCSGFDLFRPYAR